MGIDELIANAEQLPLAEQLQLVTHLLEKIRQSHTPPTPSQHRWSEICGIAPYPLMGEDAQAWISRTRSETDTSLSSWFNLASTTVF